MPTMDSDDWTTLFLLAVHSTSITLLLRYSRSQSATTPQFDSTLLVCIIEATKLLLALSFEFVERFPHGTARSSKLSLFGSMAAFYGAVKREFGDTRNTLALLAPSIAYAIQNNLYFISIARLSVVEYQIGAQLRIIWTALAAVVLLKRRIMFRQWIMLGQLAIGIAMVQLGDYSHDLTKHNHYKTWTSHVVGWATMLVATFTSGTSGVVLEWAATTRKIQSTGQSGSVWMQAAQVSFYTLLFSAIVFIVNFGATASTYNFTWLTAAIITGQSMGGLLVAYVITSIGNVERIFATSIAIVLGFLCERIAFPKERQNSTSDVITIVGLLMAVHAIWAFHRASGRASNAGKSDDETMKILVTEPSKDLELNAKAYQPLSDDTI